MAGLDLSLQKVLDVDFSGPQWLRSAKGFNTAYPMTLDVSTWSSAFYPQGRLPSGLYVGKITSGGSTGKYGKYDDAASDGRQTCVGFLLTPVNVAYTGGRPYGTAAPSVPVAGALLWEGEVILAALQTINNNVALDANGQADLAAKFRFV
jgi:hypothetical protein